jgi:hypothetical protein
MSKVSLRRLLTRLTAIALSTTAVSPAAAEDGDDTSADDREGLDLDAELALDPSLTVDPEAIDPPDAAAALGRGLALAADRMRPLSATHVITTWALADDAVRRLAVAHALEWSFPLVGDDIVLDHLSRDPSPEVRVAVARAAWARRLTSGPLDVLDRLANDPDARVREVARRGR